MGDGRWLRLEVFQWNKVETALELLQICALVGMTNNNIVEISHRIKNGDIKAKFQDRPSQDLFYKNKEKLKEKTVKDLGFQEENLIFINKLLGFHTRKLLCDVKQKYREIGIKKIVTDNGVVIVKREERGSKWKTFLFVL